MNATLKDRLLEKLAALEHTRWSKWMEYLFTKGATHTMGDALHRFEPPAFIINGDSVARWKRQLATEYKDLSEAEKESDRIEARKTLEVVEQELAAEQARVKVLENAVRRYSAYHDAVRYSGDHCECAICRGVRGALAEAP